MEYNIKYLIHLRWYGVVNYFVVFAEQIFFWVYTPQWVFWFSLGLNILTMFSLGFKISKLEKEIGF